MAAPTTLASLPEELLERILSFCAPDPHGALARPRALAPLAACRDFLRIGTPALYGALRIRSPAQADALAAALAGNTAAARAVRVLVVDGAYPALARLAALCPGVHELDIALRGLDDKESDADTPLVALAQLKLVRTLTLRKDDGVYLTHPRVARALSELSNAIAHWPELDTVTVGFRLTHAAGDAGSAALVHALRDAPALRTLRTCAPAVWSPALLTVSANASLARIALCAPGAFAAPRALVADAELAGAQRLCVPRDAEPSDPDAGTLFLRAARTHPRLIALIRAGTPTRRQRAHTLAAQPAPVLCVPACKPAAPASAPTSPAPPGEPQHLAPPPATRLARSHSASTLA